MSIQKYGKAKSIFETRICFDGTSKRDHPVKVTKMSNKELDKYLSDMKKRNIQFINNLNG